MSSQANLKKICDNGIEVLSNELEQHSSDLTAAYSENTANWDADVQQGLVRATTLTSEAIKDLQHAREHLQTEIEKLGMEADLETCVQSIESEWSTRTSVSIEFIEGVRASYRAILGEYDRILTETLSKDESGALNTSSSSLYHLINRSSADNRSESTEFLNRLGAQEKALTQKVADKTLDALTFWHEGMSGRARVIQTAMEKNQELLSAATRGMADNEPVATVPEEIERLKGTLMNDLTCAQSETEESILQLNKQAKDELRSALASSSEAGRRITDDLALAAAAQISAVETLFEQQIQREVDKLDHCKASLDASCEESIRALTKFEERAKDQQQLVANELAEEANAAALLFQQNLGEVFDRALRQVDTIMEESESELRNLADSVVERFRKSTSEYLALLDASSSGVLDDVSLVRSDCVSMLNAYMEGGDDI